jgi:hypothetical protein
MEAGSFILVNGFTLETGPIFQKKLQKCVWINGDPPDLMEYVFFRHGLHLNPLAALHRAQSSPAASPHLGYRNSKPEPISRAGTTYRLFKISSVSVRKKNAPISSIHLAAGKPIRAPHAARRLRMNSAFGNG